MGGVLSLCVRGRDSGLCPGMYGHKGGSRDFRPPPLRKGRRADYSSMKSMFTWRWNASCSEMFVSVVAMP